VHGAAAARAYRLASDAVMRMAFTSGTPQPQGVTIPSHDAARRPHPQRRDERDGARGLFDLPAARLNWGYLTLLQSLMAGGRPAADRFSGRARAGTDRARARDGSSQRAGVPLAMLNDPELERFDLRPLRVVITGAPRAPSRPSAPPRRASPAT